MTKKEMSNEREKTLLKRIFVEKKNDVSSKFDLLEQTEDLTQKEKRLLGKIQRKLHRQNRSERMKTLDLLIKKMDEEEIKDRVFNHYGNKCVCCGESIRIFLTIDHVNEDGAKHRKEVGSGIMFYKWLIKNDFPEGFQTLCRNCNWGKYRNNGICPHKINTEKD